MLAYCTTPLKIGYSPSELMDRVLRTTLPVNPLNLQPKPIDHQLVKRKDQVLKREQKQNFDRRHRTTYHSPLEPGDEVWIPDREISGQIVDQPYPRSYNIVTTGNGILRRNRQAIRALPNNVRSLVLLDQSTETSNEEKRGDRNFELRRSTRPSKPPERYGLLIN